MYLPTYLNSLTRKDGHIGNNTSMENDPVTVGSRLHDEPPDKSYLGGVIWKSSSGSVAPRTGKSLPPSSSSNEKH